MAEAELPSQPESTNRHLQPILDLLSSAGYSDSLKPDKTATERLAGCLVWCVAALNPANREIGFVISSEILTDEENKKKSEEALRSMKCPHSLEASRIRNLDCQSIFPVVQWLINRVRDRKDENQRKDSVMNELQQLRERISMEGAETKVQMLVSLMQSLKDLERKEYEFQPYSRVKRSQLEAEVIYLEEKIISGCDSESLSDGLNRSLNESAEELKLARKSIGFSKALRYLQCTLGDKGVDAKGNILAEFDKFTVSSIAGRMKLIDSLEGIVKDSQQWSMG